TELRGVHAVAVAIDPRDSSRLIAVGNEIWTSTDGGSSWASATVPATTTLDSVQFDPGDSRIAYAVHHEGALRTTNGGRSWARFNVGSLPRTAFGTNLWVGSERAWSVLYEPGLATLHEGNCWEPVDEPGHDAPLAVQAIEGAEIDGATLLYA